MQRIIMNVLISILYLLVALSSYVQMSSPHLLAQERDTAKTMQKLPDDGALMNTILHRIHYGCSGSDFDRLLVDSDSQLNRVEIGKRQAYKFQIFPHEKFWVIAWQKSRLAAKYLANKEELVLYNAVICAYYEDSTGVPEWALMILTRDEQMADHIPWRLYCDVNSTPLQRYSERPTNEDIYMFLALQSKIETHLFLNTTKQVTEAYGVPLQLVEGDVLEETWELVIGEKPTKFFPGEE